MVEQTLSIIKPDAVAKNVIEKIIDRFESNGLKIAAAKKRRRISELTLHLFEIAGGVFFNLILMYFIHHKNRKFSYWIWTWFILIIWVFLLSEKYLFGI